LFVCAEQYKQIQKSEARAAEEKKNRQEARKKAAEKVKANRERIATEVEAGTTSRPKDGGDLVTTGTGARTLNLCNARTFEALCRRLGYNVMEKDVVLTHNDSTHPGKCISPADFKEIVHGQNHPLLVFMRPRLANYCGTTSEAIRSRERRGDIKVVTVKIKGYGEAKIIDPDHGNALIDRYNKTPIKIPDDGSWERVDTDAKTSAKTEATPPLKPTNRTAAVRKKKLPTSHPRGSAEAKADYATPANYDRDDWIVKKLDAEGWTTTQVIDAFDNGEHPNAKWETLTDAGSIRRSARQFRAHHNLEARQAKPGAARKNPSNPGNPGDVAPARVF